MAWVIIECEWNRNDELKDACLMYYNTYLMQNEDKSGLAVFNNKEEADKWLQNNHMTGITYNIVEIKNE